MFRYIYYLLIVCLGCAYADVTINDAVQDNLDFLEVIEQEISDANPDDYDEAALNECKSGIISAKDFLNLIREKAKLGHMEDIKIKAIGTSLEAVKIEKKKTTADTSDLQELVDKYNKTIVGLKKTYERLSLRAKKSNIAQRQQFSGTTVISSINSLNCQQKSRNLKQQDDFTCLEIVEIPVSQTTRTAAQNNDPMPILETRE